MKKAKVTLRFLNYNGSIEKRTYTVKMKTGCNSEAFQKAFDRYLKFNKEYYSNIYSPNYRRPCELASWKFVV